MEKSTGKTAAEMQADLLEAEKAVLEERARQLARRSSRTKTTGQELSLITFRLGRERYGIELPHLKEVQPLDGLNWTPLPGAPPFIVGVVNLRGRLYSIMDFIAFLGAGSHTRGEQAHVMVVSGGRQPDGTPLELALISEDLPRVKRIGVQTLQKSPETVSPEAEKYFKGVTDEMIVVLDVDTLFSDSAVIVD